MSERHDEWRIEVIIGHVNDKPIFRNLMQFYKYESSEYSMEDPNSFGQFDYNYLDHYWTEVGRSQEGRVAYLIKVNDQLAGFALVNNFSLSIHIDENTRNIAEFFIMRKWRKRGIGKYAANYIFDTFDGLWEVKQEHENTGAHRFWERVVQDYTNGAYIRVESHLPEWEGPVIRFSRKRHVNFETAR